MQQAKVILTNDLTGLEPEADTFINNIDTGKVFIGDGDGGQNRIPTANAPLFAYVEDSLSYSVPTEIERVMFNGAGAGDFTLLDGYPDGKEIVFLNISAYDLVLTPESGLIDGGADYTIATGGNAKVWYYNGNYYII